MTDVGPNGVRSRLSERGALETNSVDRALTPIWVRGGDFLGNAANATDLRFAATRHKLVSDKR